jgi:hypothetical protein
VELDGVQVVPEPFTLALFAIGIGTLAGWRRMRRGVRSAGVV